MSGHYPDGRQPDEASFRLALEDLAAALGERAFRALVMGGVGSAALARPRPTDDIDLFVHPEDVEPLLAHLADCGFEVVHADPTWLAKAFRHGVLVDVVFRSTGDIYLDDEMLARAPTGTFKGVRLATVPPEDLLVIKAVAAVEASPHHWYDALAVLARADLDWSYLLSRARRRSPRRVLSLLLYAESIDLAVPAGVVESLFEVVHPSQPPAVEARA